MHWLVLWVVADEKKYECGGQRDEAEHDCVVLPLIFVTIEEVVAVTDPILHASDGTQTNQTTARPQNEVTACLQSTNYQKITTYKNGQVVYDICLKAKIKPKDM